MQHFSSFPLKRQFHSAHDHCFVIQTLAEYRWILGSASWHNDFGNCIQAGSGFYLLCWSLVAKLLYFASVCMLDKSGCQWFLKAFLEMGTAFSEPGIWCHWILYVLFLKARWLSCDMFEQSCWSFSWTKLNVHEILLGEQINYWGKCALCDMWATSLSASFFPKQVNLGASAKDWDLVLNWYRPCFKDGQEKCCNSK